MVKAFFIRLSLTYLLLYFLFISNYFVFFFPFLGFVHKPLSFISSNFIELVNKLFIHKPFDGNITLDDNYWLYISVASFFVLSILIAFTWTLSAKRKSQDRLFFYLHTYARYYLAFVLLVYGFSKVFGNQFSEPSPNALIETIGRLDPHSLMWLFMGASRSYSFFGGALELLAAMLLLLPRTIIVGGLLSIATMTNVLMLDIGYDTLVKVFAAHLLMISVFIISKDIKALIQFFFFRRTTSLSKLPSIDGTVISKVLSVMNICFIIYVAFVLMSYQKGKTVNKTRNELAGIYEVKSYFNTSTLTDTLPWKKIAFSNSNIVTVQFYNDSTAAFKMKKQDNNIELISWKDSLFKSRFQYTFVSPSEVRLVGMISNDPVTIIANKIDLTRLPLIKGRGKVKWTWDD